MLLVLAEAFWEGSRCRRRWVVDELRCCACPFVSFSSLRRADWSATAWRRVLYKSADDRRLTRQRKENHRIAKLCWRLARCERSRVLHAFLPRQATAGHHTATRRSRPARNELHIQSTRTSKTFHLFVDNTSIESVILRAPLPFTSSPAYGSLIFARSMASASMCNIILQVFIRTICGKVCLLYTSPSPRDGLLSRMPSSA